MTDDPRSRSTKQGLILVEFAHGALAPDGPYFERYTDYTSDVVDEHGIRWKSVPEMLIELAENTGVFEEGPTKIQTVRKDTFLDRISNGQPHAKTHVMILERTLATPYRKQQARFMGLIETTRRNVAGVEDAIEINCRTDKDLEMNRSMGTMATEFCDNRFGDGVCGVPLTLDTGTVIQVQGHRLRIVGLNPAPRQHWYVGGYVEHRGLRIKIKSNAQGGDYFLLVRPVPVWWKDQQVTVVNGCRKTIFACREYENESQFKGIGIGMPTHNPNFEQPTA